MISSFQGHGDIVQLLLDFNADVALQDKFGKKAQDRAKTTNIFYKLTNRALEQRIEKSNLSFTKEQKPPILDKKDTNSAALTTRERKHSTPNSVKKTKSVCVELEKVSGECETSRTSEIKGYLTKLVMAQMTMLAGSVEKNYMKSIEEKLMKELENAETALKISTNKESDRLSKKTKKELSNYVVLKIKIALARSGYSADTLNFLTVNQIDNIFPETEELFPEKQTQKESAFFEESQPSTYLNNEDIPSTGKENCNIRSKLSPKEKINFDSLKKELLLFIQKQMGTLTDEVIVNTHKSVNKIIEKGIRKANSRIIEEANKKHTTLAQNMQKQVDTAISDKMSHILKELKREQTVRMQQIQKNYNSQLEMQTSPEQIKEMLDTLNGIQKGYESIHSKTKSPHYKDSIPHKNGVLTPKSFSMSSTPKRDKKGFGKSSSENNKNSQLSIASLPNGEDATSSYIPKPLASNDQTKQQSVPKPPIQDAFKRQLGIGYNPKPFSGGSSFSSIPTSRNEIPKITMSASRTPKRAKNNDIGDKEVLTARSHSYSNKSEKGDKESTPKYVMPCMKQTKLNEITKKQKFDENLKDRRNEENNRKKEDKLQKMKSKYQNFHKRTESGVSTATPVENAYSEIQVFHNDNEGTETETGEINFTENQIPPTIIDFSAIDQVQEAIVPESTDASPVNIEEDDYTNILNRKEENQDLIELKSRIMKRLENRKAQQTPPVLSEGDSIS